MLLLQQVTGQKRYPLDTTGFPQLYYDEPRLTSISFQPKRGTFITVWDKRWDDDERPVYLPAMLRGVLKHECGTAMTAGFSRGKRKYYLYYRCRKCSNLNVRGDLLHEQFNQALQQLKFNKEQLAYLIKEIKIKVEQSLQSRKDTDRQEI